MGEGATTGGGGGVGLAIFLLSFMGFALLMLASMWVIFRKAGKPGWTVLVPVYNAYVMLEIAGVPGWWMFVPFLNMVAGFRVIFGLAKNFGKGAGFALGLLFLPFMFYPALAFGNAEYGAA